MNKRTILVGMAVVLPLLVVAAALHGLAWAQGPAPQGEVGVVDTQSVVGVVDTQSVVGAQAALAAGFTDQGRLVYAGSPVSDTCRMAFRLYEGDDDTLEVAKPITLTGVPVSDGLFSVFLDFGDGSFNGEERWLGIRVRCPPAVDWTNLGRQPLAPAPMALALPGLWTQPIPTSPNLFGGYSGNHVSAGVAGGTIGGGGSSGNRNQVDGDFGVVDGGQANQAAGYAAVGGGYGNRANGSTSVIGGGQSNVISNTHDFIGGGQSNVIVSPAATIGGGAGNYVSGSYGTVAGGAGNQATGQNAAVGGGFQNVASGYNAMVPGGMDNVAAGSISFAAGRRAKANQAGCFVWGGDYPYADVTCDAPNAFVVRASGGVTFYTSSDLSSGAYLDPGGGSWNNMSARSRKENFAAVDGAALLDRLGEIDITTWNYKSQAPSIRHIGPMADDFNGLVAGLGGEGQGFINSLDADGVALAAVQALYAQNQALKAQTAGQQAQIDDLLQQNAGRQTENAALRARLDSLEARLAALEAGGGR